MERLLSFCAALKRHAAPLLRTLRDPDTRALALVLGAGSADGVLPSPSPRHAPRVRTKPEA